MLNNLLFLPVTHYLFFFYLFTADVCALGEKPAKPVDTIVPTVVGCVLAGLTVILIITYFVGRCKTPAGYQHM